MLLRNAKADATCHCSSLELSDKFHPKNQAYNTSDKKFGLHAYSVSVTSGLGDELGCTFRAVYDTYRLSLAGRFAYSKTGILAYHHLTVFPP